MIAEEFELETLMQEQLALWGGACGWVIGDDVYIAQRLMFHWALLKNPNHGGYEERWCYSDLPRIRGAMAEFEDTGKLRFWHKHHTKGHIVRYYQVFDQRDHPYKEEHVLYEVDWIIDPK